jgi:hypothetical protein
MSNSSQLIPYDKIANYLIPIGLFSGFVAWTRSQGYNIILRVIFVIFAYLLNIFYLAYLVYRWIFA